MSGQVLGRHCIILAAFHVLARSNEFVVRAVFCAMLFVCFWFTVTARCSQYCGSCGAAAAGSVQPTPSAPAYGAGAPPPAYNPSAMGIPVGGGGVETIPTAVPYSVGAQTSQRDPWEKFSWASLPQEYKNNWITIGYTQASWDGVARPPRATECNFSQLSPAQQKAANYLGYSASVSDFALA
jgi:hypothetical protein